MKTRLLATLLLAAVAAGIGYWFYKSTRPLLGTQLSDLAAAAPADTQFFMAVDLRQRHRLSELVGLAREGARSYPELFAEPLKELENNVPAGLKLEEMADWVGPAACMSWFPRAGQMSLLSRERVDPPWEMAVVVPLNQPDKFMAQFGPYAEKRGAKKSEIEGRTSWTLENVQYTVFKNVWLMTTGPDATARCLAALQGKKPRLLDDAQYREALQRVEHDQGALVYMAPDRLLVPLKDLFKSSKSIDDESVEAFQSLQYAIGTLTGTSDNLVAQSFLGIDPQSKSPWAKAMLTSPNSQAGMARFIPGDWGNYHALNLPWMWNAVYQTLIVFPESRMTVAPVPMFLQIQLGYGPKGIFDALTGEVGLSTYVDAKTPQKSGVVLLIGLKDRKRLEEILDKLAGHIGRLEPREKVDGTQLLGWRALPNLRAYFIDQALVLTASPDQESLVRSLLEVAGGKKPSLAEQPLVKQALDAAGSSWVAMNYIAMSKMGGPILERMEAEARRSAPPEATKMLEDFLKKARTELPKMESSGVVLVEPQGLRMRTFGTNLYSQTVTLGMAAAIVVPNFIKARAQGQWSACKSNLKNLATALEMYATDNKGHYPADLTSLTPGYLKMIPVCPGADRESYVYEVKGEAFTVTCKGLNHAGIGVPADHPFYTSTRGLIER